MAVPKRKVTPSRKGMRSANKKLKNLNISFVFGSVNFVVQADLKIRARF